MNEIADMGVVELAALHRARSLSPVETLNAHLDRIQQLDSKVNAIISLHADYALEQARAIEHRISKGWDVGPLAGVPFGLKDVIDVAGVPTTGGGRLYSDYVAPRSSPLVRRLEQAGGVFTAKLNTMEFNYGDEWNSHYGPTRNAWDLDCYSGGSSAGPAGVVAARMLPFAIGEDTGGSIRLPCSNSGLSGIKPTYGRIPRTGMMGVAWSMDQPGPMARSAADVALVLGVVAGHDVGDAYSSKRAVPDYTSLLQQSVEGLVVGVPKLWFECDAEVLAALEESLATLQRAGAIIRRDIELPSFELTPGVAWTIITTEFSALHEITRDRIDEYGDLMAVRLVLGEFVTAVDYLRAQRIRHLMQLECQKAFSSIDVLLLPATPTTAGRFDGRDCVVTLNGRSRPWIEESPKPTQPFSLTGLPAVSVPNGFSSEGLPIGLQIVAPPHSDALALSVAHTLQQLTDFHQRRPPILD